MTKTHLRLHPGEEIRTPRILVLFWEGDRLDAYNQLRRHLVAHHLPKVDGRVVVTGYAPWIFLHSIGKRLQLQNVADWISRDALPARVVETVPLVSVVRLSADRKRGAVMLLNAGMDPIPEATVHLRMQSEQVRCMAPGRPCTALPAEPVADGHLVALRNIEPWDMRMVLVDTTS